MMADGGCTVFKMRLTGMTVMFRQAKMVVTQLWCGEPSVLPAKWIYMSGISESLVMHIVITS